MEKTPMKLGRSFVGGFLDAKINGLTPAEGWDQIAQEFKKNWPNGYTYTQLVSAQSADQMKYSDAASEADYLAQYQSLYAETSDVFTKTIGERLDMLDKIIRETYPFHNQTIQCVKTINNKQC
jgi:hypothetical protein